MNMRNPACTCFSESVVRLRTPCECAALLENLRLSFDPLKMGSSGYACFLQKQCNSELPIFCGVNHTLPDSTQEFGIWPNFASQARSASCRWPPDGAILGHLEPSWGHLGAILGPSWGILGPSWGHLGAILGHLGAILGPSWGHLGASWAHPGPILGHLGPILAYDKHLEGHKTLQNTVF